MDDVTESADDPLRHDDDGATQSESDSATR